MRDCEAGSGKWGGATAERAESSEDGRVVYEGEGSCGGNSKTEWCGEEVRGREEGEGFAR